MKEDNFENNEDEIVIELDSNNIHPKSGRRQARIDSNKKENKKKNNKKDNGKDNKNGKKKLTKKQKLIIVLSIILGFFLILGVVFGVYIYKSGGNVKDAVLNIATDIVGEQDPIFVLVLGVSEDISAKLTDTIMLCGYNPSTQKAFMLSIPRDTFVGKSEASANGYDKINAQFQKSAEKTVETVELLTGVKIDHYVIVRNISITSIFECIGSIEFDVPINMNYDDPTQDLHIHLKKGMQTLEPEQIEQLLRFRHNNDGSSYPSSWGDNDYGRMRTQREFIKAAMNQVISLQNIGKLKDIASMVYTNLQTNMSGYKVLDYVPHALKFNTSNLRSEQLPGQSAMINNLWFYQHSKSQTRKLVDELMIYLELDDETLDSHYKYGDSIKGVKPDGNWVPEEIVIDDDDDRSTSNKKDTNTVDKDKCDHNYVVYDDSDHAGCEKTGTVVYKCLKCSREYSKQTEALGHSYKNGVCVRCGKKDPSIKEEEKKPENTTDNNTVKDDNTTHECDHNYKITTDTATCDKPGTKTKTCTKCGNVITEASPATGKHTYGEWVITKQASEKEDGLKERTCTGCGKKDTEVIPKVTPPETTDPVENVTKPDDTSSLSEAQ